MTSMPSSVHAHARGGGAAASGPGSIAGVLHDMAYLRHESGHEPTTSRPARPAVPSKNMARAIVIAQQLERDESARTASTSPPR